ncbi:MAG: methyltransferase domain-containing protein [Acidobacteria bacterium]|nr:methyltransferase domain-containing protein [Acidobacteriota bacterium]MBV9478400.1 methyltransferase domain-containing protein [Acidobacteriota bacterium]
MQRRSDRARWDRIARVAPYYAVLAHPRFLGDVDAASLRAFFDSGDAYVSDLLTRVATSIGERGLQTVLEFGCGPGRLACAFARRGFTVTAVDVSPAMLALARQNAEARNLRDIDFRLVDDFERGDARFDLVNVTLVLQQMPPERGRDVLRELAARVVPGGYLHAQVPFRSDRRLASRLGIAARRRVPAINRAVNRLRHRGGEVPLLAPYLYSMDDVLRILREGALDVRAVELTKENELEVATIVARRHYEHAFAHATPAEEQTSRDDAPAADAIDVRELIRTIPIEELNRRAEEYFATTESFEAQLAKPFSSPADAPPMLMSLGALLHGLQLLPGHDVLDFGAGTGWLSGHLTRMGCRMILADVSETALRVAREHFERIGLMALPNAPRFLHYDGARIGLPDASVDRVVCFDAFHHVPNPDAVLREFGRILRPGGIAGFCEPGPNHSRSPQSQYEMRTYGVIENDVDLDAIWNDARASGFADLEVAAFNGDPPRMPLERFEEIFRGGEALANAAHAMRRFLESTRVFFLRAAGEACVDSRTASALACDLRVALRDAPRAGAPIAVRATVMNTGTATWLPSATIPGGVSLGCHLYANGALLRHDYHRIAFDRELAPGEKVIVDGELPPLDAGVYELEFDCVAAGVAWFAQVGSAPARVRVDVRG